MRRPAILVILSVVFGLQSASAAVAVRRIPAFPGAEGFGACAQGGRRGRIIEVTNLNSRGPGSLRAACMGKDPRIVVFRVSGIVDGDVSIWSPFITIAGQTAPGDGICLRGKLAVLTHDVIIRHLRVRPGDGPCGADAENRDCIGLSGARAHNVIIDHCSASWGTDENLATWSGPYNVTFQWCITSEALQDSIHPKGPHGKGMILGSKDNTISIHHCLFAHNDERNPMMTRRPGAKGESIFDIRNNVIYNHGRTRAVDVGGNGWVNFVGNLVKLGPGKPRPCGLWLRASARGKIYVKDNIWPGKQAGETDHWRVVGRVLLPGVKRFPETYRVREPVPAPPVTTDSPRQAYQSVLRFAGCTRPVRDVVDARIVAEVRARTGRTIDSPADVGGYPSYAATTPPADADHDAMPDAWEKRHGFDPNDASDGPKDRDGDGYTNVEEFLNETDPTKPDTGAPITQAPVKIQSGNDRIHGQAARRIGRQRLAAARKPNATKESGKALLQKVRESDKEAADFLGIKFVRIRPGEIMIHKKKVAIPKTFEISTCEITQAQWEKVMGTRPWSGRPAAKDDPNCPASYVSYVDCREFVQRLNASGRRKYRLPTFHEWTYAADAGTNSTYGFGKDRTRVREYACCRPDPVRRKPDPEGLPTAPQPVARLKPNPWGLHDMAGNVHEWCEWPAEERPRYWSDSYRRCYGGNFRYRVGEIMQSIYSHHRPHYRGFGAGFRLVRDLP